MLFAFVYSIIVPFPDDIIMIPAGLSKYPFWKIALSTGLGKIILNTFFALTGYYG